MGVSDYVRSSYKFADEFNDSTVFQTKDIEPCVGGSLETYYIDPSGVIWKPDYVGTYDIIFLEEGDPEYNDTKPFLNIKRAPTGKRGRYRPLDITNYVTIYPEYTSRSKCNVRTRVKIHFVQGIIQNYEVIHYQL